MANGVFAISLGRERAFFDQVNDNDPANAGLVVVLLKTTVSDAALNSFDTLAAVLADGGVDEADFTNYARKTLTDSDIGSVTINDGANTVAMDIPDLEYVDAGGASNNSIVKAIVCFDADVTGGADSAIIPITHHDITFTTQGLTFNINVAASGFLVVGP